MIELSENPQDESEPRRTPLLSTFIETRQSRRFMKVCTGSLENHLIALCYGEAGVGKTRAARRFARWGEYEKLLSGEVAGTGLGVDGKIAFFTPDPLISPKRLEQELLHLHAQMKQLSSMTPPLMREPGLPRGGYRVTPLEWGLLIIDEADRLKPMGLEVLRDFYDRNQMGLVLIGMPGLEKRLARYPQFFSRVGFVHEFCTPSAEELREIVVQQVCLMDPQREKDLPEAQALDEDAVAAIIRMTGGNFRFMYQLLLQIERILRLNHLSKVTKAVVEAARASLLFGREG